mgnify:CR=1 FL=1
MSDKKPDCGYCRKPWPCGCDFSGTKEPPTPAPLKDVREAWADVEDGKFVKCGDLVLIWTSSLNKDSVRVRVTVEEIE